ncbi:MAG: hypothetical protein NC083_03990 [Muribaculum sp.]|nr:hypothetical protein [Bacteroidales bacterium]MCM1402950.1 hypothetical protein [Bacteroides sp.]MCM1442678.1 hypothetical protein [Muribaculum sp.]
MERSRLVWVRGDTIVVRDTLLRERVRTVVHCDTIRLEKEVLIEKPVRYVPRFYKICCGALTALIVIGIAYGAWRMKR